MIFAHPRTAIAAAGLFLMLAAPAIAQRGPAPEQQMFALQQQLAASQASAARFEQRLGAIERQLQQIVNGYETSAQRLRMIESAIQDLRAEQTERLAAIERAGPDDVPAASAVVERVEPLVSAPPETRIVDVPPASQPAATAAADPGEDAYTEGFRLWEAKRFDAAIASLRAFATAFPTHRRVSWANNLTGRALLDKGEPRAAAQVLLANYRNDPRGGRAQDSLYYLGQSLLKLGQADQACKAYAELTSVYGSAVRGELQALVDKGRSEANCR